MSSFYFRSIYDTVFILSLTQQKLLLFQIKLIFRVSLRSIDRRVCCMASSAACVFETLRGCWALQRIKNQRVFHFILKHPTIEFISTSLTLKRWLQSCKNSIKAKKVFFTAMREKFSNWSFVCFLIWLVSFVFCAAAFGFETIWRLFALIFVTKN